MKTSLVSAPRARAAANARVAARPPLALGFESEEGHEEKGQADGLGQEEAAVDLVHRG